MSILGAQTDELIALASQLGTTTGDIATVQGDTHSTSRTVIDEMQASFSKAINAITTAMGTLRGSVDNAAARLDATTWTGSNRETFQNAYRDFNAAMGSLEGAVNDAYTQFDAQMNQVAGLIEEFQGEVSTSLDQAQESTTSMQEAVNAQRENLESVMNTGLSVG